VQGVLQRWGFQFATERSTGGSQSLQEDTSVSVRAVPIICGRHLQAQDVPEFIDMYANGGLTTPADLPQSVQSILQSVACRSAIMFGDCLVQHQMCEMLNSLMEARSPFQCAHGRPTTAPLVDIDTLQEGSYVRQKAARTKAASIQNANIQNLGLRSSVKERLQQQLAKFRALDPTSCAADFLM
jgi:hypothetical protein